MFLWLPFVWTSAVRNSSAPVIASFVLGGAVMFAGDSFGRGLRCPRCRNKLGILVRHGDWAKLSGGLRFCPYCALDLDGELDPARPVDVSTA
jgi:hypothetical protein